MLEYIALNTIGRIFWPPTSVAVLAEIDESIIALDKDSSYELPGGIVEYGESLHEAARREFKEETGLDITIGNILDIKDGSNDGVNGIHYIFSAINPEGDLNGTWEGKPEIIPKETIEDRVWSLHHSNISSYLFPEDDT